MSIYHMEGLYLAQCHCGQGLFCRQFIPEGQKILTFKGPTLTRAELPDPYEDAHDSYLQIGRNLYMGPFSGIELYVNHSCSPSAACIIKERTATLTAIRDIQPGQEIHYDYSTTMCDEDWELECRCGSKNCRGKIREFKYLPTELRLQYLEMGIIPNYLRKKPI